MSRQPDTGQSRATHPGGEIPLVFIIGSGRCGTTMLRELLSQHSRLEFPIDEMQFLPRLIEEFGDSPDFHDAGTVQKLFARVQQSGFSFHLKKKGLELEASRFGELLRQNSWAGATEALIRLSVAEPKRSDPAVLVGDKSPHYIVHLERLARLMPGSRFIHLVRDPRDVCRSSKKAWGKSTYRAAVRWRHHLEYFHDAVEDNSLQSRCITVRYEDLLSSPADALTGICAFLGVAFEPGMLALRSGAEQMGDAAGSAEIVRSNYGKYRSTMSARAIRQIEGVTWTVMQRYGYAAEQAQGPVPVNWAKYNALGATDLVKSLGSHIRQKGLVAGVRYRLAQIRTKRMEMRSRRRRRGL